MSTHEDSQTLVSDDGSSPEDALRRERDELHDRPLRTSADFDNYRKRTDRERREQADYAAAELIKDILPALDDIERALAAPVDSGPGADRINVFRDGLILIHRQLLEVLRRRGVEPLEVVGQDFNPEWHEALAKDPLDGRRDGEITAEIRRGYRLGTRLLRAAMVKVAHA